MLLTAVPREGLGGVAEVIITSLPLDSEALVRLAGRLGGEIALYDETGRLLASSLPHPSVLSPTKATAAGTVATVTIDDVLFACRSFPLTVGQKTYGRYSVLWPVAELRTLTVRLAALHLAGMVLCLVLFYFLYRRIIARTTSDIEALTGWAQGFSQEYPTPPPALPRADEVGVLSQVFTGLVGDLKTALEEVEVKNLALGEVNVTLEDKVTEKTREVEEQRRVLDSVLSGMRQAVFLLEADHRVAYANQTARDLFGEVEGRPCSDVWGANTPCDDEAAAEIELARDGRIYLVTATPLGDDGRSILVAQDVTERRGLEKQLQQAQKLESVGRLAGGVAHDFNNVLGSIVPCVDILRRRLTDSKEVACLDTIESATDRASSVVRQLLAFGRSGEFQPIPLELNAAVEGALGLLRRGLEDVRLVWLPGGGVPLVRADETQIQQVVLNLVLNAVDAMGGEGSVTVETRSTQSGRAALVAVEDTGPGIPPHIEGKVFDPFFPTKDSGKGTGLGLSIVYGVVERHAGQIRVSSPAGRGARFEIELPALRSGPRGAATASPVAATLLLVDDDALLLSSLAECPAWTAWSWPRSSGSPCPICPSSS
jgi:signal transduction histidine kinase